MRLVTVLCLCLAGLAPAARVAAQSAAVEAGAETQVRARAVLELFTSQACSSCPPADALFNGYAGRKDLVTLTFHVDYWDYLGWKDTLASGKFTERQRAYAKAKGDGMVYTPQVVVNGRHLFKGSNRVEIEKAVERSARQFQEHQVALRMWSDKGQIVIETGSAAAGTEIAQATVWLAAVQKRAEVTVQQGENSGKTLVYSNVVRELTPVGSWNGKADTIRLDESTAVRPGVESCAALLQQGKGGPIIGVAWLTLGGR